MRKIAIAAPAGVALVLFSSTPAGVGSSPRVRHIGNTAAVTRSGKSVEISAEYRCPRTDSAKVSATVTQWTHRGERDPGRRGWPDKGQEWYGDCGDRLARTPCVLDGLADPAQPRSRHRLLAAPSAKGG